jgi:hypothetical protein
MKRKSMVLLLVVCVILPTALSAAVVDLSLGATAQYNQTLGSIKTDIDNDSFFDGMGDFKNYTLGADLRVKFLIAEVDVVGTFGTYTDEDTLDEYTEISTLTTAGVSMDLLGIARLGFGMGPRFRVLIDDAGNAKIISADNNEIASWENFGDTFIDSPVAFRTTVDFNLGNMMLGLNYTLDTDYTFRNAAQVDDLFNVTIDEGRVGVSLLFSLF